MIRQRLEAAESMYRVEFGELPPMAVVVEPPPRSTPTQSRSRRDLPRSGVDGPLTGLSWQDAISQVLTDAGTPLHVREIWRRLDAGGFRSDARDPLRSIVAVVLRTAGIVRAAPNTYGLAGSSMDATALLDGE